MHLYVQTVFEGLSTNTYEMGLRDLYKYGIQGPYGFDVRTNNDVPLPLNLDYLPDTMKIFRANGTPRTVIMGRDGSIVDSRLTSNVGRLTKIIDDELLKSHLVSDMTP